MSCVDSSDDAHEEGKSGTTDTPRVGRNHNACRHASHRYCGGNGVGEGPSTCERRSNQHLSISRHGVSLVGTVAGDKKGFGIFLDRSANTEFRLKTGQEHKGWILREVRGREIVLEKGSETAILKLPIRPLAGPADEEGKDLK